MLWCGYGLMLLGRLERALETVVEAIRLDREFSSRDMDVEEDTVTTLAGGYRNFWREKAYWTRLDEGLRKAGLPD